MLKILQARLQQYVNCELLDVQAGFRKGRGTRDQIASISWIIEKARGFQKNIYFCFIDYDKMLGASTRDPTHDKVMRRRPDKQGRSGLQGFWKAAPALTLKMISVFLMLAILDYSLISVIQVEGLPQSLSKQNQLRTWINMSPGWWYPIRLSRIKGVLQFRPLYWHSSLFGKCVLMHFTGWGSPIKKHTKYYSKSGYWINVWLLLLCWSCAVETIVNIVKDLEK